MPKAKKRGRNAVKRVGSYKSPGRGVVYPFSGAYEDRMSSDERHRDVPARERPRKRGIRRRGRVKYREAMCREQGYLLQGALAVDDAVDFGQEVGAADIALQVDAGNLLWRFRFKGFADGFKIVRVPDVHLEHAIPVELGV